MLGCTSCVFDYDHTKLHWIFGQNQCSCRIYEVLHSVIQYRQNYQMDNSQYFMPLNSVNSTLTYIFSSRKMSRDYSQKPC